MRYLVIEDREEKRAAIERELKGFDAEAVIESAVDLRSATVSLLKKKFDLVIFDIFLPVREDEGKEEDISAELLGIFAQSANYHCESIALTAYAIDDAIRAQFNNNGITVVQYDDDGGWKASLAQKLARLMVRPRCDFLIFCALSKERAAFSATSVQVGEMLSIAGLNCQEISLNGYKGFCITPQRMGLVNMAITVTKSIEVFQPTIAAMSGICAGIDGETKLLDLVIGDLCWEYQTGKFKDNKFQQEPYQAPVSNGLRVYLEQAVENKDLLGSLKNGLFDTELKDSGMVFGPISSGSAVVADISKMLEIAPQHRKWAGLEMEMYAFYEAASQALGRPAYFGAKCVVDMGNSGKGDKLHLSACTISARFVVSMLAIFLPKYVVA
jgi:nucleoside phosphorylase/CheY-like chemotaxis protein